MVHLYSGKHINLKKKDNVYIFTDIKLSLGHIIQRKGSYKNSECPQIIFM